jgi:hypothetical protein
MNTHGIPKDPEIPLHYRLNYKASDGFLASILQHKPAIFHEYQTVKQEPVHDYTKSMDKRAPGAEFSAPAFFIRKSGLIPRRTFGPRSAPRRLISLLLKR